MPEQRSSADQLQEWLDVMRPLLEPIKTYTWTGPTYEHSWEILQRAAVVRQWEALEAMMKMHQANFGHFGVTLLRPAFEELVWIEYLKQVVHLVPRLPSLLVRHEIAESLNAQNEFMGRREMAASGFSQQYVKVQLALDRRNQAEIKEIGQQLGWRNERSLLPSMRFLTRKVGREKD
jgi:hypothetical protein